MILHRPSANVQPVDWRNRECSANNNGEVQFLNCWTSPMIRRSMLKLIPGSIRPCGISPDRVYRTILLHGAIGLTITQANSNSATDFARILTALEFLKSVLIRVNP